ncbi:proteasome regulatory particle base subunit [Bonamia ostreae]|uniref:Dolichyl-diphosphooligosaccharide--protein glycosyltransferase subunit 1 n=1 Tax=Bonamia ostreae TaxID=126728 RepID=A0ABV2AHK4_9EUKA
MSLFNLKNAIVIFVIFAQTVKTETKAITIINENVERKIFINDNIIIETLKIRAKNTKNEAVSKYKLSLYKEFLDDNKIAFVEAKRADERLKIDKKFKNSRDPHVDVHIEIPANSTIEITANLHYVHLLKPHPEALPIHSEPSVMIELPAHFVTSYRTLFQTTVLETTKALLPKIYKADAPQPFSVHRRGARIVCGPYRDIYRDIENSQNEPGESIRLRAQTRSKLLAARKVKRSMKIGLWGKTLVSEKMTLHSEGNRLEGDYSPIFEDRDGRAVEEITAFLPKNAKNIKTRDVLGFLYEIRVEELGENVKLTIPLRFPLIGGWKTALEISYQLPTSGICEFDAAGKVYRLKMESVSIIRNLMADEYTLEILFPEGSSDFRIRKNFFEKFLRNGVKMERVEGFKVVGKMTSGKIFNKMAVKFNAENFVSSKSEQILMEYKLAAIYLFLKPLLFAVYIFLGIFCCYSISNILRRSKIVKKRKTAIEGFDGSKDKIKEDFAKFKKGLDKMSRNEIIQKCDHFGSLLNNVFEDKKRAGMLLNLKGLRKRFAVVKALQKINID